MGSLTIGSTVISMGIFNIKTFLLVFIIAVERCCCQDGRPSGAAASSSTSGTAGTSSSRGGGDSYSGGGGGTYTPPCTGSSCPQSFDFGPVIDFVRNAIASFFGGVRRSNRRASQCPPVRPCRTRSGRCCPMFRRRGSGRPFVEDAELICLLKIF